MSMNQLPENMGKKIVEALKRQALLEEESNSNQVNQYNNMTQSDISQEDISSIKEESSFNEIREEEPVAIAAQPSSTVQMNQPINRVVNENHLQFSMSNAQQANNTVMYNTYSAELPTNVAVLKKLILQLPAGVSKQVGAQIIRQTVEALGISMNSVLQEAQQVQETLNSGITDCTIKIQEYKNQIMQLEANTREYQRQMAQINDLISLFILTDNKK
ncbi:hypothetical protein IJG14_06230 [bacterium]|nr:hypothetical protein [bacterium]